MILVEAGRMSERAFDAKVQFATTLSCRGHPVVLDEQTAPDRFDRSLKYEAAPFLACLDDIDITRVVMIGADDLDDDILARLRALGLPSGLPVVGLGHFSDRQSSVHARTRLAYALGREPTMVDLSDRQWGPLAAEGILPMTAVPSGKAPVPDGPPEVFAFLPAEWLEEPHLPTLLAALANMPAFRLSIVTPSPGKDRLKETRHSSLNVYGYSELGPRLFARRADIAVFFGDGVPGERMAAFAMEMMASGKVVIDGTAQGALVATGAPAMRGPEAITALPGFLDLAVLPNLAEIGRSSAQSDWIAARHIRRLEVAIGLDEIRSPGADPAPDSGRIVFVPTNGSGLGHAQRCALVASDLSDRSRAVFSAFPSCVELIRRRGFPCLPLVQKSDGHPEEYANDIVNYLRLRRTLRPEDHLVFDGGYVFDSIYRTIHETGCRATWIRRGLWQPGQVAGANTERERAFRDVLVPGEAFEELNIDYSRGTHVHRVGPIVQPTPGSAPADVRRRLAETLDTEFDTLVVTMLGGGVASDRTAQIQTISALLDRRPRCLHLVVVWPNSRVSPGHYGWPGTRVVRTHNSLALAAAADLVVSAAGYNSFHELLYHGIPTIFIPQVAPYLDDQERRARAASERGLAETVLSHELLRLDRAITPFLDGGEGEAMRNRLRDHVLPEPGNRVAARLIEDGGQT
jgi:UDP:flavonoid glycosyltransferase YjiC (YdhE family)